MGRQNTIRINYGALPVKPGLQKFCAEQLGLKRGEVIRIQNCRILNVTYVTIVYLALANKVCEEHGKVSEITGSDKKKVPSDHHHGSVLVKLHDLSVDVQNDKVAKFLEQNGDVHEVYEDQLGDDQEFVSAYTGIRIAKMVVNQHFPADGENENKAEGDGNETDSSTSSRRSKRNKNKRQKYNKQDEEEIFKI